MFRKAREMAIVERIAYKNALDNLKPVTITVCRMGYCQCGNSLCTVYPDGTVEYDGNEKWQNSPRMPYNKNEDRNSESKIAHDAYVRIMRKFNQKKNESRRLKNVYKHALLEALKKLRKGQEQEPQYSEDGITWGKAPAVAYKPGYYKNFSGAFLCGIYPKKVKYKYLYLSKRPREYEIYNEKLWDPDVKTFELKTKLREVISYIWT